MNLALALSNPRTTAAPSGPRNESPANGAPWPESMEKIRAAFEQFQQHSLSLQTAYDGLKHDLAVTHSRLREKNDMLSHKVGELRRMSSRLECIVASLTDGVLVVDGNLAVEICNPVMARLLGWDATETQGRPYRDIANGLGDADTLTAVMADGKSVLDRERIGTARDGRRAIVLASAAPILDPSGHCIGAVEVMRDITELRRLEERVQNQKRMAALGEMAASVAHEIRNPLGTIEGFARLLKRDLAEQPEHLRLAEKIVEGVQNLNYVIVNMLTYARPMSLQCEPFSAARLLADVEPVLRDRAKREGVRLRVRKAGAAALIVDGDIRQWRQALLNLGINAIEACLDKERTVNEDSARSVCGEVVLQAAPRDERVVFSVRDNGCGIAVADQARLFDPFFTKKYGGTGLGLSLCHKIVAAHGGEIQVNSREGEGSVFEALAPRAPVVGRKAAA